MTNTETFLSWPKVKEIIGHKSRATIERWIKEGRFPPKYKIGKRSIAWKKSEIDVWATNPERYDLI